MASDQSINIKWSCKEITKKLIPTLRGQTSVEKVTADAVETATELELGEEPEGMIELLQSYDKT